MMNNNDEVTLSLFVVNLVLSNQEVISVPTKAISRQHAEFKARMRFPDCDGVISVIEHPKTNLTSEGVTKPVIEIPESSIPFEDNVIVVDFSRKMRIAQ